MDNQTEFNDIDDVLAFLTDLFERRGADAYLGEDVTMAEHMCQAAAAAQADGRDEEVIVAALLHDIGHFYDELTERFALEQDNKHQVHGERVLSNWFSPRVVACVGGHVDAKRYLCAVDRSYFERLSAASVRTLELQGGPMDEAECASYAKTPFLEDILAVRRYDDAGKDTAVHAPGFEHYVPMIRRVCSTA